MCSRRIVVIGLDSVPLSLLFNELRDEMPTIKRLIEPGLYSVLESCHPPITVPAWMVMMTSKNPGRLGIYGFRHRRGSSYSEINIANSTYVRREMTVWDIVSKHGRRYARRLLHQRVAYQARQN
ncbi:MAG: alkaline phosphatase family protein [Aigarchaeota archaeon]|nr:alkaline phosphatase family protein [Candidatus Pelearchaeum maunauluense]